MPAMFALGVLAGSLGGTGLRAWWLARHSAPLNDSIRDGMAARSRTMEERCSGDRYPTGRCADER